MAKIEKLIEGYQRFHKKYYEHSPALFETLVAEGQSPKTLVIACVDSRIDPAIVLDAEPGDILVIRNVANLVPPYEPNRPHPYAGVRAGIEFAVRILGIENIVIFGHSLCGGINSLVHPENFSDFTYLSSWMDIASPAKDRAKKNHPDADGETLCQHCEQASVINSLENLKAYPWVADKLSQNELNIHGWYINLNDGILMAYNDKEDAFAPITTWKS